MALTVVIRSGDSDTPASITFDAPRIVIGRGPGSEVLLPDPSVSLRHASIRQRGPDYVVIDEGSTNGTYVGPVRLSPQAPRVLGASDLVRVGRVWLEIRVEQAIPTANPQATTREIALGLVANAFAAQGETLAARVRIVQGNAIGKELLLTDFERTYVLGRAPECDLCLEEAHSSRRHLEVKRRGQHVIVRDLGTKNGSDLGGRRLPAGQEVPWLPGTPLVIGPTQLSLEDPLDLALKELEASADEPMRPDEPVDPPAAALAAPTVPAPKASSDAPLTTVPESSRPAESKPRKKGPLGLTEALVALLALTVLALSLLGLVWVLQSK
jgi:pSer/pThr/pTyr-binding forkhead associated (FHA) protein